MGEWPGKPGRACTLATILSVRQQTAPRWPFGRARGPFNGWCDPAPEPFEPAVAQTWHASC
ncbi:hypothetical protein BVI1335_2270002 [Burkholderia vietnamiensis]|nr:hypothetical protein BVI1335_2270002 [Burkholderia vietnamiensis]